MRKLLLFISLTGLNMACGGETTATGEQLTAKAYPNEKKAVDGQKIFKQYCVTCHGVYGDMGVGGAANLTLSSLGEEERIQVVTNGRNTMPSFSSLLNEEKIRAVAEYTMQLTPGKE